MSVNPFVTPQGRGRVGTKTLWCCIIKWRQKLPLGLIWAEWAQIWILYFFSHVFHLSAVCGYWAVCLKSVCPVLRLCASLTLHLCLCCVFIERHRKAGLGFFIKDFNRALERKRLFIDPQLTQTSIQNLTKIYQPTPTCGFQFCGGYLFQGCFL